MTRRARRKCRHCKKFFIPDPRNIKRQRYCREPLCRAASKAASQRGWLSKPENRDVFKGPIHVARVQAWRQAHPGYWRRPPPGGSSEGTPLQVSLITQAVDNKKESGQFVDPALQDLLSAQAIVLIGLIAQFTDSTLQDDISRAGQRLLRLGHDVLHGQVPGDGQSQGSKSTNQPRQSQAPPPTVQLD
jgi:hypothetical protein